jgi:hypothetical protein
MFRTVVFRFYGWEFTCTVGGKDRFSNVVNAAEEAVYLTVQMDNYLVEKLLFQKPRVAFDHYCAVLGAVLSKLPGVGDIRWEECRN